jgi:hypothetical protein
MGFRIDRNVGDVGRPNSRIPGVAIWPTQVPDDDRFFIVVKLFRFLIVIADVCRFD